MLVSFFLDQDCTWAWSSDVFLLFQTCSCLISDVPGPKESDLWQSLISTNSGWLYCPASQAALYQTGGLVSVNCCQSTERWRILYHQCYLQVHCVLTHNNLCLCLHLESNITLYLYYLNLYIFLSYTLRCLIFLHISYFSNGLFWVISQLTLTNTES